MIQTYEKIPVKVQAVQLFNTANSLNDLRELMGDKFPKKLWNTGGDESKLYMFIPTSEGKTKAVETNFITKDKEGEFYVYNQTLFNKIYKLIWD